MTPRNLRELQTCGLPRPTAAAAALRAASLLEQSLLPSHHPGLWEDLSFPVFQVTLPEVPPPDSQTRFAVQLLALVALVGVSLALVSRGAAAVVQSPPNSHQVFSDKPSPLFVFQPSAELTWLEPDLP